MILYSLLLRVAEHNIERVRKVEKMEKIREVARIKWAREVEEDIGEIK